MHIGGRKENYASFVKLFYYFKANFRLLVQLVITSFLVLENFHGKTKLHR